MWGQMRGKKPATALCAAVTAGLVSAASASAAFATGDINRAACSPRTESAAGFSPMLPDCRAYERVSPLSTNGAPIGSEVVSQDGSAVGFQSLGLFGGPGDAESTNGALYTSLRDDRAGWSTAPDAPSAAVFLDETPSVNGENHSYSGNLLETLFTLVPVDVGSPIDFRFYRHDPHSADVEVGPTVSPQQLASWTKSEGGAPILLLGATNDLSHIFFTPKTNLLGTGLHWIWPGDTTRGIYSLYEYSAVGNTEPDLVAIKPGAGEADSRPAQHPTLTSECGAALGGASLTGGGASEDSYNAISSVPSADEARVVYFSAFAHEGSHVCDGAQAPAVNELYARIEGRRTVAISEPASENCEACDTSEAAQNAAPRGALFQGASQDGSRVFFLSEQRLFDGTRGESGDNLYEFNFAAPNTHEKLALVAPELAEGGGVMRVSADGSHVYLVSGHVIAGTSANEYGVSPTEHADNLYVFDTRSRATAFIAQLSPGDSEEWRQIDGRGSVEVTPDGRFLLFGSTNDVTPDASGELHQLYRYSAEPTRAEGEAGVPRLVRVSVGDALSENGNSGGNAFISGQNYESPDDPALGKAIEMTDDGSRVFFQDNAALAEGALNKVCAYEEEGSCISKAQNVYEWEDGHVYLLSDGKDAHSNFQGSVVSLIGASPTGADVYLKSADPLAGESNNEAAASHIYDARVEGGFGATPPPSPCTSSCQGSGSPPPELAVAASAIFSGAGNLPPGHGPTPKPKTAAQLRAEALAKALKACRKKHNHHKRLACEKQARKRHGRTPSSHRRPK